MRGFVRTPALLAMGFSLVVVGVGDAIVLDLTRAYFSSGFNGQAVSTLWARLAFFLSGAVLDLAFITALWLLFLTLSRPFPMSPPKRLVLTATLAAAIPLAMDVALNKLHTVLGDVLHLGILMDLAGGSIRNAMGEASAEIASVALLCLVGLGGIAAALGVVAWLERRHPKWREVSLPRARTLLGLTCCSAVAGALLLFWTQVGSPAVYFGLSWKPSGIALGYVADRLTDLDGDGYGLLTRPVDPAPLDPRIHPMAVDVPGNGIDEDAIDGDLPLGFRPPEPIPVVHDAWQRRPPLVLVFLEGFRADVVGAHLDGHPVTPFLDHLAREGTSFQHAYVHTPMTWESREQLFQGRVAPLAKPASTLVDDFHARGYYVAWFSGQDDASVGGREALRFDHADHFYDARQDRDHRTSRSTAPISLQVSWKTVLGRVRTFLAKGPPPRPLFLYVNFVDTHFPYWHDQMDDILGTGRLPRSHIRRQNREEVWRAYLNSAANVDRAIGELQDVVARALGDDSFAMIVISDHGESFYEDGTLGHGQNVDEIHTRVPLIVRGIGGDWPELIASSDLRGLLSRYLPTQAPGAKPMVVPTPERKIFQFTGRIGSPSYLALRTLDRLTVFDPISGRQFIWDAQDRSVPPPPRSVEQSEMLQVVRSWEALHYEEAEDSGALETPVVAGAEKRTGAPDARIYRGYAWPPKRSPQARRILQQPFDRPD